MKLDIRYKKVSGIYRIRNLVNNKFYIGSATCLYTRFHTHKFHLSAGTHANINLLRSFRKHGEQSFLFEVIELCEKNCLINREQYWLDKENPSYNICKNAANTLGYKLSKEVKEHLSKIRKGKPTKGMLGKKHLQSTKDLMANKARERGLSEAFMRASKEANTGRKHTVERIAIRVEKQRKLNSEQVVKIKELLANGIYQYDIAKQFGISQRLVCRVKQGIGCYGSVTLKFAA